MITSPPRPGQRAADRGGEPEAPGRGHQLQLGVHSPRSMRVSGKICRYQRLSITARQSPRELGGKIMGVAGADDPHGSGRGPAPRPGRRPRRTSDLRWRGGRQIIRRLIRPSGTRPADRPELDVPVGLDTAMPRADGLEGRMDEGREVLRAARPNPERGDAAPRQSPSATPRPAVCEAPRGSACSSAPRTCSAFSRSTFSMQRSIRAVICAVARVSPLSALVEQALDHGALLADPLGRRRPRAR